jgi:hypothetical protein
MPAWDDGLLDTYLVHARDEDPDLFWAWQLVNDIVCDGSADDALALTLALVERTPPPLLYYVAAGPLEDLLAYHGPTVINQVLDAARRSALLSAALGGVWGHTRFDPEVYRRVQAFLGRA